MTPAAARVDHSRPPYPVFFGFGCGGHFPCGRGLGPTGCVDADALGAAVVATLADAAAGSAEAVAGPFTVGG
jgi:hypothetical protein